MASSSRDEDDVSSLGLLQSVKRQVIPSACKNCRTKKCDGHSPCGYCSRRGLSCEFESRPNETTQQARKRKFEEVLQRSEELQRLYQSLAGTDETTAVQLFRRIRSGANVDSVLRHIQHGIVRRDEMSYDTRLKRAFLFSLVQSNASLQDVAEMASDFLTDTSVVLPSAQAHEQLRDRVVTLEKLRVVLADADPTTASDARSQFILEGTSTKQSDIMWVPAEPWVQNVGDEAVSHLISFFFSFLNHSWQHVECESFLAAMRSRDIRSEYCSPFLVNAVLAFAAVHSDMGDDITVPEQFADRGMQFHDEAIRLWNLEEGRASIANIQGLACLAVECIMRGKDVLGLNLLGSAIALNNILPCPDLNPRMSKSELGYLRLRGSTWWTAVHVDLTCKLGLLLGGDTTDWRRAPDLSSVLPDTTEYWKGYPAIQEPVAFHPNILFLERCTFTRFLWEAVRVVVWDADRLDGKRVHAEEVSGLSDRLLAWYEKLPSALRFTKEMPPSLYDLHMQYYCVQVVLHERTHEQLFGPTNPRMREPRSVPDMADEALRDTLHSKTMEFAYKGATAIRTFRERYGLKVMSLVHLNHSAMGVFVTLNDLHANPRQQPGRTTSGTGPIRDTQDALEEFFRVLLATSLRWTMARGFSRTANHTAQTLGVQLPSVITDMVKVMSDALWTASDLDNLSGAVYPNWSLPHVGSEQAEGYRMGKLLRMWEGTNVEQTDTAGLSSGSSTSSSDASRSS